jgi:hypothetical protein
MGKPIPYEYNHKTNENGEIIKLCNKHHIYFPDEDPWFPCNEKYYYKNSSNHIDGFHTWCKKCAIVKQSNAQKENPEVCREKCRIAYKNNQFGVKDIIRASTKTRRDNGKQYTYLKVTGKGAEYEKNRQHKNHIITEKEWNDCKEYFNNECAYCGLSIKEHYGTYRGITKLRDFHKEHQIHDGANDLSNCIPSCKTCNSYKWKFGFDEWYNEQNPKFSIERYNKIMQWINKDYKLYIKQK